MRSSMRLPASAVRLLSRLARLHRRRAVPLLAAAVLACTAAGAQAQNIDAAKALGLFQSIMGATGQPAPAAPAAAPNSAAGIAGALLGNSLAPAGVQSPAQQGAELIQLLSQSVAQIDEPHEIQIGQQLAAVLLGSKALYPDLAVQRYVNQLGRWISLQSSRPNLPWTFAVLDDPGFNAFAAPGGYVFVTKGLLDKVTDEGELAGILAHEISHVTARHHLIAMNKTAQTGLLTRVVASQFKNDLAGMVSSQFLNLGRDLYSKGLDQQDEFDADRTGVALATRAGFDPYGLVAVLQQLRTASPDDALFALSLSTHPAAQARLDQLEQAMGNRLDPYTGATPTTINQRVTMLAAASARPATPAAPAARKSPAKK